MLSKLAYLTLCRSIQLLATLARGDAAKDLEILVLRRQIPCPRLEPIDRALLAAVESYPEPAGRASSSPRRRCSAGTGASSRARGPTRVLARGGHSSTKPRVPQLMGM